MAFPSRISEVSRRVALVAGIAIAAWLAWLTDLRPYVTVALPPPEEAPAPRTADETALLRHPRRSEPPAIVRVSGAEWARFFARAETTFAQNLPAADWEHRIKAADLRRARKENARRAGMTDRDRAEERETEQRVRERYGVDVRFTGSFHRLYFHRHEPPFDTLGDLPSARSHLLVLEGHPARALAIDVSPAHELVDFFDVNPQPETFVHPFRRRGLWILGLAVLVFVALPRRRPGPDQIAYQRWRIAMGDVGSAIMFGVFVAIPLAAVGGSREALTHQTVFTAVSWAIAGLGLLAFYWTTFMAAYALTLRADGFDIHTLWRVQAVGFRDIAHVQGARLRPPRWLVTLSFVAAFLGSSRVARMGQLGRALMLAGSAVDGLRVVLRSGAVRFVWVSDQMGNRAMTGFERLMSALDAHGVARKDEVHDVRAVFPAA